MVLTPVICKACGEEIPLALRFGSEDLPAIERALKQSATTVTVERYCPFCMASRSFELPLPRLPDPHELPAPKVLAPDPLVSHLHLMLLTTFAPAMSTISLRPPRNLLKEYRRAESLVGSGGCAEAEEARRMLPAIIEGYEARKTGKDPGNDRVWTRSVAATKVLLARALQVLGQPVESGRLAGEALPELDPELDRPIMETARIVSQPFLEKKSQSPFELEKTSHERNKRSNHR